MKLSRPSSRSGPWGVSLVELIVGTMVFGIITTSVGVLLRSGLEYLRVSEAKVQLQKDSLFVLSQMTAELAESSPKSIRHSEVSEPEGIVFGSPRGMNNGVTFENSRLQWKTWTCFYWNDSEKRIYRTQAPLAAISTFVPDPTPLAFNRTVDSMLGAANRKVLARNVSNFQVTGLNPVKFTVQVEVGSGNQRSTLTTQTAVAPTH